MHNFSTLNDYVQIYKMLKENLAVIFFKNKLLLFLHYLLVVIIMKILSSFVDCLFLE